MHTKYSAYSPQNHILLALLVMLKSQTFEFSLRNILNSKFWLPKWEKLIQIKAGDWLPKYVSYNLNIFNLNWLSTLKTQLHFQSWICFRPMNPELEAILQTHLRDQLSFWMEHNQLSQWYLQQRNKKKIKELTSTEINLQFFTNVHASWIVILQITNSFGIRFILRGFNNF